MTGMLILGKARKVLEECGVPQPKGLKLPVIKVARSLTRTVTPTLNMERVSPTLTLTRSP